MPSERFPGSLPVGVTEALWQYTHLPAIADDYDEYFAHNRLFQFDEQVVAQQLESGGTQPGGWVADLGCGTGRVLVAMARRGYPGIAVDLSPRMLAIVRAKTEGLPVHCLRANLVELNCLADRSCRAAVCLFSTLGMIRGRENRQRSLQHMRRILRPGGPLILHVHNYWYNLYDSGGPRWIVSNTLRALLRGDIERGDKFLEYRGVSKMYLHVFRRGELCRALRRAGFRVQELIPLAPTRHRALRLPWLFAGLRANGWIAVCR